MGARKTSTTPTVDVETLAQSISVAVTTAVIGALSPSEPAKEAKVTAKHATTGTFSPERPEVRKARKSEPVEAPTAFRRMSKDDFRALKSAGHVPAGMTQKEAFAQGLIGTEANGEPKVRVRKTSPAKAQKRQAKARKSTKATVTSKSATSWGKSFSALARTSGLYVNTSSTKRAKWESLYHVAVQQDWAGVCALRDSGLAPKDAFEEYQSRLVASGHDVEHYTNAPGAARVRNASRKAFADRISNR